MLCFHGLSKAEGLPKFWGGSIIKLEETREEGVGYESIQETL